MTHSMPNHQSEHSVLHYISEKKREPKNEFPRLLEFLKESNDPIVFVYSPPLMLGWRILKYVFGDRRDDRTASHSFIVTRRRISKRISKRISERDPNDRI